MADPPETFALICGGGTAGHVLPAIAIGRALVDRGHPASSLHFVGSSDRLEQRLVPEAGFSVSLLPGRGIERRLTLSNVSALVGIASAFLRCVALVRSRRPRVVLAMGGFASVPCGLAALLLRVPLVVAEQNATPGAANRLLARFAKVAAVAFPGTPLPRATVTGNPVRAEVVDIARSKPRDVAKSELGVDPGRSLVVVMGGSLGAQRLNRAVLEALPRWEGRDDLVVRHIVGDRDWEEVVSAVPPIEAAAVRYEPIRYEDDMPLVLDAADLAVCRAGSSTCFELAAAALPAVLVPSPNVTGDHQTANARHLVEAGAAVMVADRELDGERLVAEVDALLCDPHRRSAMSEAASGLARPAAADDIAGLVEQYSRKAP